MAYVSEYGNYGVEDVFMFDYNRLTVEQWDTLAELPDSVKMNYVRAIVNGADLSEFEDED